MTKTLSPSRVQRTLSASPHANSSASESPTVSQPFDAEHSFKPAGALFAQVVGGLAVPKDLVKAS